MKNKNFGIVIVTFNPQSKDDLKNKIVRYLEICTKIVVVDNGSDLVPKIPNIDNVILISNKTNYGHAKALNIGCEYLRNDGYSHALLLGQDSIIENESIKIIWNCIRQSHYAMVGPKIIGSDKNEEQKYLVRTDHWFKKIRIHENEIKQVYTSITSGSLLDLNIWHNVGGFWNELFIEKVDDEFAIRLHNMKYEVVVVGNAYLTEPYGESKVIKKFGLTWHPTFHKPWRLKLLYRNKEIIKKKYFFSEFPFIIFQELSLIKRFVTIILFEKQKIKKVYAIISGTMIGFFSNLKRFDSIKSAHIKK